MDLDNAKENIQPLACGRNVRYLEAALNTTAHQEILEERKRFEDAIRNYEGDDPLEVWFQYIRWIEQSYPSGGRESGLDEVLLKCITAFESDQRYYQDRRMIKLYIKYIDTQPNPQEFYQELYNQGIGTMVSDLYICWAYYYDLCGNFKKADSIFRKGLDARAQPYDELDEAHKHFGFTMSQRILYEDDEKEQEKYMISLQERRHALTSLRGKKKVGSIRTGSVVKTYNPGKIQVDPSKPSCSSNAAVQVFEDQNACPNFISSNKTEENASNETSTSGIRSIIDSARKQENIREPGPWSKAKQNSKIRPSISTSNRLLSFEILEDDTELKENLIPCIPNNYIKGIQLPDSYISHNAPQEKWKVPICLETEALPHTIPMYNKTFAYPKLDCEYSPEEYFAYKWYKRNGKENKTTVRLDPVWANDVSVGMRIYPNFAHKNLPQEEYKVNTFLEDDGIKENRIKFAIKIDEIYPQNSEELQIEEILAIKIRKGERKVRFGSDSTILMEEEMDETKIITNSYGRRSIFPSRKSIAIRKSIIVNPQSIVNEKEPAVRYTTNIPQTVIQNNAVSIPLNEEPQLGAVMPESTKILNASNSIHPAPQCQPQETAFKQPCQSTPFKIYEEESVQESPTDPPQSVIKDHIFKTPAPTGSKARSFQIYEEETANAVDLDVNKSKHPLQQEQQQDFVFKTPVVKARPFQIYEEEEQTNESCSTQTFNFFIKAQSISTPKHKEKSQAFSMETNLPSCSSPEVAAKLPLQQSTPSSGVHSPDFENVQAITLQPKQLSTIMETTESNTGSSAVTGSTKSSVDTQMSSPEYDTDMIKSNQPTTGITSKFPIIVPETIQEQNVEVDAEESLLRSKFKNVSRLQERDDTFPFMMKSLRPFEEKTETVPKMMLVTKPSTQDEDMYNVFIKTPEKVTSIQQPKLEIFEIDDSMTIPTISKMGESFAEQSLKIQKDMMDFSKQKELSLTMFCDDDDEIAEHKLPSLTPLSNELILPSISEKNNEIMRCHEKSMSKPLQSEYQIPKRQTLIPGFEDFSFKLKSKDICFESPKESTFYKNKSNKQIIENLSMASNQEQEVNNDNQFSHFKSDTNDIKSRKKSLHPSSGAINKSVKIDMSHRNISISKNEKSSLLPQQEEISQQKRQQFQLENANNSIKSSTSNKERIISLEQSRSQNIGNKSSLFNKSQTSQSSSNVSSSINTTVKQIDYFEDNVRTETLSFAPNATGIKNSTWLPNHVPVNLCQIQEKSFHVKEQPQGVSGTVNDALKKKSILTRFSEISKRQSTVSGSNPEKPPPLPPTVSNQNKRTSSTISHIENAKNVEDPSKDLNKIDIQRQKSIIEIEADDNDAFEESIGRSIYYKITSNSPHFSYQAWSDEDDNDNDKIVMRQAHFENKEIDLEITRQVIEEHLENINVNPFENTLINAFLDQIDFMGHLEEVPTCLIVNKIPALKKNDVIQLGECSFDVLKIVAKGGYGTIFCAKERTTDKLYAIKQQKPPSLWEYYICLELKSRLTNEDVFPYFMDVEYAMIGQSSSLLISSFSKYGCLITVCNKVKHYTGRNVDEYITMMLASQMLSILDNLHASNIIHADIKPDNFLLISKLSYDSTIPVLQLIDFGMAIDLAHFPPGQTFTHAPETINDFTCIEMREKRAWTFQTDLFGLAGSIHVLLFGKYMNVEKRISGWTYKNKLPRYFNKSIWDIIFNSLLNIRDCKSMPNLQYLRTVLEEELVLKEKYVRDKITQFNHALE